MKKLLMGVVLTAGLVAAGSAQARTNDSLADILLGVSVGSSAGSQHHNRRDAHHFDHRPVRNHHASARHNHHHPRGNAHGYWRKHDKHHYASSGSHHGRSGWDRRDGARHDRDDRGRDHHVREQDDRRGHRGH